MIEKSSKRIGTESRKGASRRRGIPYGIDARRRIAAGAENHDFPPNRRKEEA